MKDYLQLMFDLASHKELQGIHFWATVYVLIVLAGSLWHIVRVRRWPSTQGQLLELGVRPLGTPESGSGDQDHVPSALYRYRVDGVEHQGREISVWKMSASGALRKTALLLPRLVKADASGAVDVFYLTRSDGRKLEPGDILPLRAALLAAAGSNPDARAA